MRARVFLVFLTLLAPFLAAGEAVAQPAQPLDRLLPQIRRNVPGQFLDAEGATNGGAPHYHLKWLTPDGRVMWLDTDARTGRVLSRSPGRDSFDAPRYRAPEGDTGGPPDRREEGRGNQRYDGPGDSRYDNRQQYRGAPGGDGRARNFGGGQGNGRGFGGFGGGRSSFGGGRSRGGR